MECVLNSSSTNMNYMYNKSRLNSLLRSFQSLQNKTVKRALQQNEKFNVLTTALDPSTMQMYLDLSVSVVEMIDSRHVTEADTAINKCLVNA